MLREHTVFSMQAQSVAVEDGKVKVCVTVKNTGSKYAGREVVQVYVTMLGGMIEKPFQELVGFAKT